MPDDIDPHLAETLAQASGASSGNGDQQIDPQFDEAAYLRAFPDVAIAVERGDMASGLFHYALCGRVERRLQMPAYLSARAGNGTQPAHESVGARVPRFSIDVAIASESGAVFIVGWADDRQDPLVTISVASGHGRPHTWTRFPRLRRPDVETVVQSTEPCNHGFWVFCNDDTAPLRTDLAPADTECLVELRFESGVTGEARQPLLREGNGQLRDTVMGYFSAIGYHGNRTVEAFTSLDLGAGDALIRFNRALSDSIAAGAATERFGPNRKHFTGSIIVPLFGISEFFFLQSCLYSQGKGIADYEFIYVINSPELIELIQREARLAEMIYGLSQTLVMLPDNLGFGAANNVAARYARSDRLLCVNPDVFPRVSDWAQRHSDLLNSMPAEQTRFFGTSLYYDDGSLMHGGMYFDMDTGLHVTRENITRHVMLRVEHYGKGAPAWADQFVASRRVPAVTGAFISIARDWFEKLGGFTQDYIFGHYEDADLCLKSLAEGAPVWVHDIPMWHLEGKGAKRLPPHEGGSLLNRWLFSRNWQSLIVPELIGQLPGHRLLREAVEIGNEVDPVTEAPLPVFAAKVSRRAAAKRPALMRVR
nr:hypothetical protein [uncultured Rhodopila sp.]